VGELKPVTTVARYRRVKLVDATGGSFGSDSIHFPSGIHLHVKRFGIRVGEAVFRLWTAEIYNNAAEPS
jgi:hypothetical protein